MKDYCSYVNIFHGCAEIDLPTPEGIAASWHFIKGLTGNTSPAACLPFGKFSCGCYSGGYPTGYGRQEINSDTCVRKLSDKLLTLGVSHMHQHGTGGICTYYNYAVTTPFFGSPDNITHPRTIAKEDACPGYYSLETVEDKLSFEVTMAEKCAVHQYHFGKPGGRIAVDFANNGLYNNPHLRRPAYNGRLTILSDHEVAAEAELQGVRLYFHVICENASCVTLYSGTETLPGTEYSFASSDGGVGVIFDSDSEDVRLKVAVASKSAALAAEQARGERRSFAEIADAAYKSWNKYLSAIAIEADERTKRIFYSNFYHSLTKPSDWSGESHLYDTPDYMVDFATMWDIYKTELPLIFSLYPEISTKIVNTYLNVCDKLGIFPNCLLMYDDYEFSANQSSMLGDYLLCDAYYRDVQNVDWNHALDCAKRDMLRPSYDRFRETGSCEYATHTLDMAEGACNIAAVAKECGRDDIADFFAPYADNWKNAFDPNTGLLTETSEYYEGNHWNYSFRPMNDMSARIALCDSINGTAGEAFLAYLDRFFGFTDAADVSARFEGYNNESDMESPASYLYLGKTGHDRFCDVVTAAETYMFPEGRGDIPGNNDSGGTSSCYLWNTLGLFPITGQNLIFAGCPQIPGATLHLANGKTLSIVRQGEGKYVESVSLNGRVLDDFRMTVREMMEGGEIVFCMR